ncbi:hypothetical protein H6800_02240 [Candidatus Nomurabacteria bacterium]|nr:hypothetical protein [Candidatus Nomurabacteria bacterium]
MRESISKTASEKKHPKSAEEYGEQIGRIADKLIDRASKVDLEHRASGEGGFKVGHPENSDSMHDLLIVGESKDVQNPYYWRQTDASVTRYRNPSPSGETDSQPAEQGSLTGEYAVGHPDSRNIVYANKHYGYPQRIYPKEGNSDPSGLDSVVSDTATKLAQVRNAVQKGESRQREAK